MSDFSLVVKNILLYLQSLGNCRDERVVLFGSWFGERFADTSRFLFQYLSSDKERLNLNHVVWVSRSETIVNELNRMGYEAYLIGSPESDYFHKKAKYHIICNRPNEGAGFLGDIDGTKSFGAKRLNLWHGVMPLKGVGNATNTYKRYKESHPFITAIKEFLTDHSRLYRLLFHDLGGWGDCYYLSVTEAGTKILKQFFRMPDDHYIETSNPRVKPCIKYTDEEVRVLEIINKYKKVILYTPTFRDVDSTFDFYRAGEYIAHSLRNDDVLWVQKPHTAAFIKKHEDAHNILNLPSAFDLNVIIPKVSLLVTDYSSVAADAMYYHIPILYYMPDYEEYSEKDRGFLSDPRELMVSDILIDLEDLKTAIINSIDDAKLFFITDKYEKIRKAFWGSEKDYYEIWQDIKIVLK